MSSEEWQMVAYAGAVIGLLGLSIRFAGMDRFHRLFFCVFFPLSIQLVLFWLAYELSAGTQWLGTGVLLLALVIVPVTFAKTMDLALKQVKLDTLSLAISSMLKAAFIPLIVIFLALLSN